MVAFFMDGITGKIGEAAGSALGDFASTAFKGLLGGQTAAETAEAQREANQANIRAQAANQQSALDALQGSSAFGNITRNEAGGFDIAQKGAPDVAEARSIAAFGDVGSALRRNELLKDPINFTLPTRADARKIIEEDNARRMGRFQEGLGKLLSLRQRTGGGIQVPGSDFEGATVDAIGQFTKENRLGTETDALNLYNKAREADLNLKRQELDLYDPQIPYPTYATTTPGGTASNIIVQSPPTKRIADVSDAIPFQAAGGIISQLQAQEQARQDNKNYLEALRVLANQRAGVT